MEEHSTIYSELEKEYRKTLNDLSEAEPDSAEANWHLKKLDLLHKQRMGETESLLKDYETTRTASRDAEDRKEKKKDRIIKIVVDGAAILVPILFSGFWMAKGMRFEQTGTYTSRTGQWIKNNMSLFKAK